MHLIETGPHRLLLDCGLRMGMSAHAQERNRTFPFEPRDIDAVVISHAHVDHCGNVPNLVRQGYEGPIFCTPGTRTLMGIILNDSARIQEEEADLDRWLAIDESSAALLYTAQEVGWTLEQCQTLCYGERRRILPGVTLEFADAGHLLGSAMVSLTMDTDDGARRLTFTGDLGRPELRFLSAPAPLPAADVILCESTYGARAHRSLADLQLDLEQAVRRTAARGGKVLIPAFSLGRAQVVVHYLLEWMSQGRIPELPIYVDSPLAADIAQVYRAHPDGLAPGVSNPATAPVAYLRRRADSHAVSMRRESCILVASGGMCEAGRILNHLEHNLDDPRNTVVLVSHQAPGSLGRKLLQRGPTVRFRGKHWNKWADIVDLNGFSGHADQADLLNFLRPHRRAEPTIYLVHGDAPQSQALQTALYAEGFDNVCVPERTNRVEV
jgi:metallo-beta-lactamase family protein